MTHLDEAAPRTLTAPQWDERVAVGVVDAVDDRKDQTAGPPDSLPVTDRGPIYGRRAIDSRGDDSGAGVDEIPGPSGVQVSLYTSSASGKAKTNSDTRRMVHLLKAHGARFRLIDLADDTSSTPSDRLAMLNASDCIDTLPQLHVNGKFVGTADEVQEMEDFAELSKVLAGVELDVIVEATRKAIEQRLLEDREWSQRRTVARKHGFDRGSTLDPGQDAPVAASCSATNNGAHVIGIRASSVVKEHLTRRDSKDVTDLEFS